MRHCFQVVRLDAKKAVALLHCWDSDTGCCYCSAHIRCEGTGRRLEFQTVGMGGVFSGHVNSAYYVVNDADKWADIWKEHTQIMLPQPSLPDVDFSRSTIIAVFMGQCLTTGFGIEIKEIIDTSLSVVIKVEKTYPSKGCVVSEMLTYPYHIVNVDKIDKYIIFDTITRTIECE